MKIFQAGRAVAVILLMLFGSIWAMLIPVPVDSITGSITGNESWSGYINMTGDVYIESGAKLTIEAGTIVEVRGNYGIFIAGNAALEVTGTSGSKVTFFNSSGAGWDGIQLNSSSSTASLNYTNIFNATTGINATSGGSLTLMGCNLKNNIIGIQGEGIDPLIEHTVFEDNTLPIFFHEVNGTIRSSTFFNNPGQIIWVDSTGGPRFENNHIMRTDHLGTGNAIELSTTNIQFKNNSINDTGGNGLLLIHCDAYVYNNTIYDNGRYGAGAGIRVDAISSMDTSIIEKNNISTNSHGIILDRRVSEPSSAIFTGIINNEIHHNKYIGVGIFNYSQPVFDNNSVHNNSWGILTNKVMVTISNSTILSNSKFDMLVEESAKVTALNTKYGTASVTLNAVDQYLEVVWFLHVTVEDMTTLQGVAGAEVLISTMASPLQVLHRRLTGTSGQTMYIHVLEKTIFNSGTVFNTPYRISAEDLLIPRAYVKKIITGYGISGSRLLTILLAQNLAPSAPAGIQPAVTHNTTPRITWNPSTDPNGDPVMYYFKLGTAPNASNTVPVTPTVNTYFIVSIELSYDTFYFVGIRAGDTRYANSTWTIIPLYIRNNKPSRPEIAAYPPNGSIYTDTNITIKMINPSTDDLTEINDFGETIRYSVVVKIDGEVIRNYSRSYVTGKQFDFVINFSDFDKGDIINVTVTPYDGHGNTWNNSGGSGAGKHPGNGTPATLILHVSNSKPKLLGPLPYIMMDEDTTAVLPKTFREIFSDIDGDTLLFEFDAHSKFDIIYNPGTDRISIRPVQDYFTPGGIKDQLTLKANDLDGGITSQSLNVIVSEVNDAPEIVVDEPQVAYQGKRHYINITAIDNADQHDASSLNLMTNYTELPFNDRIIYVENSKYNISLFFSPTNEDIGCYYLNITADDMKDRSYYNLMIIIENVNDPPEVPVVISPVVVNHRVYQIYNTSDMITFEADASDPDEKYGDVLSYRWVSNISGVIKEDQRKFEHKIKHGGHHNITVTVTDKHGFSRAEYFYVFVIYGPGEALPETELIYPLDEMTLPWTGSSVEVTFLWEPREHEYSDLFQYEVEYWIDELSSVPVSIKGITENQYSITLQVNRTYYWWVVPSLGGEEGVEGRCFSGKWELNLIYHSGLTPLPEVTLVAPEDGSIINSDSIELEWVSNDEASDNYVYQIYLDEDPIPSTMVKNFNTQTSYTAENLKDNTTYYWNVLAWYGFTIGITTNGPFSFTVKKDKDIRDEITISPDDLRVVLEGGGKKTFSYIITNTGDNPETLTITVEPDSVLKEHLTGDTEEMQLILDPGDSVLLDFTLDMDELGAGDYKIKLKIANRDKTIFEQPIIEVSVKEKERSSPVLWIVVAIVIVIVGVLLSFFLLRRKKREEEEELEEAQDTRDLMPETDKEEENDFKTPSSDRDDLERDGSR